MELKKEDWIITKQQNENLIKINQIQIIMATEMLELCDQKISEFKED